MHACPDEDGASRLTLATEDAYLLADFAEPRLTHAITPRLIAIGADAELRTHLVAAPPRVARAAGWTEPRTSNAVGESHSVGAAIAAPVGARRPAPYPLGITVAVPIELEPPSEVHETTAATGPLGDPFALLRAIFGSSSDADASDANHDDPSGDAASGEDALGGPEVPFEDVCHEEDDGTYDERRYNPWDNNDDLFDEDDYDTFFEDGDDCDDYDVYVDEEDGFQSIEEELRGEDDSDEDSSPEDMDEDPDPISDFGDDYALIDDVDDELNDNFDDLGAGIGHPDTTLEDWADPDESQDSDWDSEEYE